MKQPPPPPQEVTASVVVLPRPTAAARRASKETAPLSLAATINGSTPAGMKEANISQLQHHNQQQQQQEKQNQQQQQQQQEHLISQVQKGSKKESVSSVVSCLATNQHTFLSVATDEPFERAILPDNHVPYYINHAGEVTQWDHPVLSQLMSSLIELNEIKFSAYRTGLKLKVVQKYLSLNTVPLDLLVETFDRFGLRAQNDKLLSVPEIISCLQSIFETVSSVDRSHSTASTSSSSRKNSTESNNSQSINIPLAIDLSLNWILNLYDTASRSGLVRVLSFKVALVALCDSCLLDKYKFMFRLIADTAGFTNARRFGLLLHDLIQIPRFLGEAAYFGGSNIEPSVRSCFTPSNSGHKKVPLKSEIESTDFLKWLQLEPQSLVWLPVMHRMIASDTIVHQVKCNICKAFPIHGLRYRCLRCFNFDCCQGCFLTDRISSKHNTDHPMQEYCLPTSSSKDLSDFSRILRNKLVNSKRSPRYGYLPVQTVLEGDDLESPIISTLNGSPPHHLSISMSSPNSPLLRLLPAAAGGGGGVAGHQVMSLSSTISTPPPVPAHMSASHNQIANLVGQHKQSSHLSPMAVSHSQNIASSAAANNAMHNQSKALFMTPSGKSETKINQAILLARANSNTCIT